MLSKAKAMQEKMKTAQDQIKKIEVEKNFNNTKIPEEFLEKIIKQVYTKIGIKNSDDFKEYLGKNNINYEDVVNKYNLDACTSRAYIKSSKRKIPKFSYLLPDNLVIRYKNPFIHGSLIIKKEILNKLGNYDENFYYAQDYKLFNDLLQNKYKIKTVKKPLYILNMEDNISLKFRKEQNYYAECVRNNLQP